MSILDDNQTIMNTVTKHAVDNIAERFIKNPKPQNLTAGEFKAIIDFFRQERSVEKRYASYDFCYLYFQSHKGNLGGKNLEYSCMQLWSYLASWGMLRGSSALLQCSPAVLEDLILYFDRIATSAIWKADVDKYPNDKGEILQVYKNIADILSSNGVVPTVTLVTKIMLGVFGCVPAIDTFFYKTFHLIYGGFGVLKQRELDNIERFYCTPTLKAILDNILIPVMDFDGNPTEYYYKKAKLIDMFGFFVGQYIK